MVRICVKHVCIVSVVWTVIRCYNQHSFNSHRLHLIARVRLSITVNLLIHQTLRYNITVRGSLLEVYCDMTTDGGGYTYYPCSGSACPSVYQANVENGCTAIGLSMVIPRSLGHWTRWVLK